MATPDGVAGRTPPKVYVESRRIGPTVSAPTAVASVEVSLTEHRATIAYDDAKVTASALVAAVEDAGYDASA